jgi:hypothetical protein
MIDVRRSLGVVLPFDDPSVRQRLDWPTGALVRFGVSVSHEGSARPSEVVRTLFGEDVGERAELARLALWARPGDDLGGDADVDPLHLDVLRGRPAVAAPGDAAGVAAAPAAGP